MKRSAWWMAACSALALACGGGGGGADAGGGGVDTGSMPAAVQGSCDHRPSGSTDCLDLEGYPASEIMRLESECVARAETWSSSACPRAGVIGGCRYEAAGMINTYWFYSGDVTAAMTSCTMGGARWVSP